MVSSRLITKGIILLLPYFCRNTLFINSKTNEEFSKKKLCCYLTWWLEHKITNLMEAFNSGHFKIWTLYHITKRQSQLGWGIGKLIMWSFFSQQFSENNIENIFLNSFLPLLVILTFWIVRNIDKFYNIVVLHSPVAFVLYVCACFFFLRVFHMLCKVWKFHWDREKNLTIYLFLIVWNWTARNDWN